jgi:hypothetical protein
VAFGNETYKLNLKKLELQLQQLHYKSGRQLIWQVSLQSPDVTTRSFGCALRWAYYEIYPILLPVCKTAMALAWYASIAEEFMDVVWIHICNILLNFLQLVVHFKVLANMYHDIGNKEVIEVTINTVYATFVVTSITYAAGCWTLVWGRKRN